MNTNKKEKTAYILTVLLAGGYSVWWLANLLHGHPGDRSLELYSDSYWVTAVVGVVCGFFVSKLWGGFRSLFGRALLFFTLGLAAQVFGQITYSYFALVRHIDAPYPSIGDIGYFGSVILYILGVYTLSKALGVRLRYAGGFQKLISILVPLILLATSYMVFLKDYQFSGSHLITFLDFGYPLGQALYISIALFAYILSAKLLGGKMKNKILLLLFALLIQYCADFSFLFRFSRDTWYAGDFTDFLYQLAYLFMTLALIQIGGVARKLKVKAED